MTSAYGITDHEASGKFPVQHSLRKIARGSNDESIENNGGEGEGEGDAEPRRRGYTMNDRRDMQRMGKRQELMVCTSKQGFLRRPEPRALIFTA